MSIVAKIPSMSDGELFNLYQNCVQRVIGDHLQKTEALEILKAVNAQWRVRLEGAKSGDYKAESPEKGVLATVGYKVGNFGEKQLIRRKLLDFVMQDDIPFCGSPAHMHEWGVPLSVQRYRKLHRVLASFRTGAENKPHLEKAWREWVEDIQYIEHSWKVKVR